MSNPVATPVVERETLIDCLQQRASAQPEQIAYTFLHYREGGSESFTYRELDQRARAIGRHVSGVGGHGKPVFLLFPSGLEYIAAYFGCLYAGAIAVPMYPPHSERDLPRIQAIIADAQGEIVLTTTDEYRKAGRWLETFPDLACLSWITTDTLASHAADSWQGSFVSGDTLAFLQYTSGSTKTPRGVMVSHANLMYNLEVIHASWRVDQTERPVSVSWLPLFHDMGLIMGVLSALYSGYPLYFMSPADFLQSPLRWLQAISDYRGTFSCGPNFAYELCLRRVSTENLAGLDLSCWKGAGNAAEPVRSDTLERFTRFFAACGLSPTVFRPGYGLAEATLVVTCGYAGEPVYVKAISKQRLEEGFVEAPTGPDQQRKVLVGCGRSIKGQDIVIVDPATLQRCEDTRVGEIWLSGPGVTLGYWRRPEETAESFQAYLATGEGPFLRTGDLGVYQDDNLLITGRIKDLIILSGRNIYPQDIELTAEQAHPAIRAGHCIAFSYESEGEERLVILAEINPRYRPQATGSEEIAAARLSTQEIVRSVRKAITEQHEVRAHEVLLLKMGALLKTSSGKPQRRACLRAFLEGTLQTWTGV